MGYDTELFIEQPVDDNFLCSICHLVLEKPVVLCEAGHTFCNSCISGYHSKLCPTCRRDQLGCDPKPRNLPLQGIIMEMKVRCPAKDDDNSNLKDDVLRGDTCCGWEGRLEKYISHVHDCSFIKKPCPDCRVTIRQRDLRAHLKNDGEERFVTCPQCSQRRKARLMDRHIKEICQERIVTCKKCNETMTARELITHEQQTCPKRTVSCSKCAMLLSSRSMKQHAEKTCPERSVVCDFCKLKVKAASLEMHINNHCSSDTTTWECNPTLATTLAPSYGGRHGRKRARKMVHG